MKVVRTRDELATVRAEMAGPVGVVMTMGALHEGHGRLITVAHEMCASVLVTVFVNPLQFAAGEDLDRYPRPLADDLALCERLGVDVVFVPTPEVIYPSEPVVRVSAGAVGDVFEGAARPGHFDGVLTVVLKLMHLTAPDVAYFGQKDAQQLACIRSMVRDLDVPVRVHAVPTVRADDGLALSSRNIYLSAEQRAVAPLLYQALATRDLAAGRALLDAEPGVDLDYLERVDPTTLEVTPDGTLFVVAARVGTTRLIDNLLLEEAAA